MSKNMRILKDTKEELLYIVHYDDIQITKEGNLYSTDSFNIAIIEEL